MLMALDQRSQRQELVLGKLLIRPDQRLTLRVLLQLSPSLLPMLPMSMDLWLAYEQPLVVLVQVLPRPFQI